MGVIIKHLHSAVKEIEPTHEEWLTAIKFLTDIGHMCSEWRRNSSCFPIRWVSPPSSTRSITGGRAAPPRTRILRPFYIPDAPRYQHGANICLDGKGEPTVVRGRVVDTAGNGVEGALLDVWQTNNNEYYDVQQKGVQPEFNLRGVFTTTESGEYGSVRLSLATTRFRMTVRWARCCAHLADIRTAPPISTSSSRRPGTTRLSLTSFEPSCQYLAEDTVFGVKETLIADFKQVTTPNRQQRLGLRRRSGL